jgi:hypothetical protein
MDRTVQDEITKRLFSLLPKDQVERVFSSEYCDISPEFLGFVDIYESLSKIIPLDWTVVDLGCSYATQSFFFKDHRSYVGVDVYAPIKSRFFTENTTHFYMSIADFVKKKRFKDKDRIFAICSYVPPWKNDNMSICRHTFKNVFTYYPSPDERKEIPKNPFLD